MWRSSGLLLILLLLLGFFLSVESRQGLPKAIDDSFVDWLAANASRRTAPAPCALITISDANLENGHALPWSPLDYALFLQGALELKPAALAIEPVLDWPGTSSLSGQAQEKQVQYEHILRDYILKTPRLLLSAELGVPSDPELLPPLQQVPYLRRVKGDLAAIPEFTAIPTQPRQDFLPDQRLQALGFVNLPDDTGAVARFAPLLFSYRGEIVPSFVLQAVMLWYHLGPDDLTVEAGSRIALANGISIPINARGEMRVDFGVPVTRVNFDDLLVTVEQVRAGHPPLVPVEAIRDRLVLLGRTDQAARTLSLPALHRGSPAELFSSAIATVQNGKFIRSAPWFADLLVVAAALALTLPVLRSGKAASLFICLLVLAFYLFLAMTIFSLTLITLPLLLPLGLLAFLALFRLAVPAAP